MTATTSPANWRPLQRIKNNCIFKIICFLLWLVKLLPTNAVLRLGHFLGHLGYYLDIPDRRRAMSNLNLALGDEYSQKELRNICKRSFEHMGRSAAEMVVSAKELVENPNLYEMSAEDQEYWNNVLASKRSVIAMTGHFGNWELLAQIGATIGGENYTVAKQLYDPRLTQLIESFRGSTGLKILWRQKHHSIRPQMLEILKNGGHIALLNDQHVKVKGIMVPFFGHPAYTATGGAELAFQTNSEVIGIAMMRQPSGRYRLILKPIEVPNTSDIDEYVRVMSQNTNIFYEKLIREYPEQWTWLHHRWKGQNHK